MENFKFIKNYFSFQKRDYFMETSVLNKIRAENDVCIFKEDGKLCMSGGNYKIETIGQTVIL